MNTSMKESILTVQGRGQLAIQPDSPGMPDIEVGKHSVEDTVTVAWEIAQIRGQRPQPTQWQTDGWGGRLAALFQRQKSFLIQSQFC